MRRRDFLQGTVVGGVMVAAGVPVARAEENPYRQNAARAELKLSSQENRIPGSSLREKVERLEKWGAAGIEFWGAGLGGRVREI